MGRNAAFGRPSASERFREWWGARSKTSRQNTCLALGVGALFVAIVMAATARDQDPSTRRVIASRVQPTTTLALPTPATVTIGDLGATVTAADLFGLSTTTTAPPAPATTGPPPTRPAPTVATTAPRLATTVTNPDIIFTTPESTTTTQARPTTTRPPTTTTTVPATTTTRLSVPLSVPNLVGG